MSVTQDVFNEDGKFMRKIRSFVRREGRLTKGQEKALEELWPVMGIDFAPEPLDMVALFGREAPVVLEIGFGMGASLVEMAKNAPEKNFIGIEVHSPGVGACLGTAQEAGVTNLRVICHDAVEVLEHMIPNGSLSCLQLFFPDPGTRAATTSAASCSLPLPRISARSLPSVASSTWPPTGRTTPSTCWR
jgi:tRNA (guanine-N7-)-methyltransferase